MPVDLNQAKSVFLAALEMPAHERAAFLEAQCGGDDSLRQRVESMLQAHDASGELLPRPALDLLAGEAPTSAFDSQTPNDAIEHGEDVYACLSPPTRPGSVGRLGHYEIQGVLGQGGFGTVFKAFDERLHRVVAIKVLSPAFSANGAARKRFVREARAAAAVKNEHVVGIYDVQEEAQPPYLVMELIDGISLQDKLDKHGALGVKEILRIGMQMAEGLVAAHKQGLVHRDIKPANILLENGVERVKITDFGLARAVDDASVSQSGTVAGTPMYMSPEQAEGLPIDHRSDLFSLGTVLYAMCTGHPPFRAGGTMAVLKRVIEDTPRPLREINGEMPDWLEAIVAKLHAKKPEKRFQTAKEVAELLGQHLAHLQQPTFVAKPATPAKPSPAPRQAAGDWARQRRIAAAAFAVVGVIIGFAGVMMFELPAERVSPAGVHWLIAGLALTFLLTAVFLGFTARRWRLSATVIVLLTAGLFLAIVFRPHADYPVLLKADDPRTVVRIWPTAHTGPPQNLADAVEILGTPMRMFPIGESVETLLPAGNYWLTAELDGREVDRVFMKIEPYWFTTYQREEEQQYWGPVMRYVGNSTAGATKLVFVPAAANLRRVTTAAEPGWVPLFNGKDLTGWNVGGERPDAWTAENDCLVGALGAPIATAQKHDDFHLRATVLLMVGEDAGIAFRSPHEEIRIRRDWDSITVTRNSPAGSSNHKETLTGPIFVWIRLEVIAEPGRTAIMVNGKTVLAETVHLPLAADRASPIVFTPSTAGALTHFRDVRIKEATPAIEPGWVQLFNGKDLTGWRLVGFPENSWQVRDGLLWASGGQTYLVSDRKFTNFHLKAEFRVSPGCEGRILFRSDPTDEAIRTRSFSPCAVEAKQGPLLAGGNNLDIQLYTDWEPKGGFTYAKPFKADGWVKLDLIANGDRFTADVDVDNGAVRRSEFCVDPKRQFQSGPIILQLGKADGSLEFRKIEIKELPSSKDQRADEEKLQGTWRAVSVEQNGVKSDMANPNIPILFDTVWTFTDDKVAMTIVDRKDGKAHDPPLPAVVHLNPHANPKQISLLAPLPEPSSYGIYRLEDDLLTVCYFTALPKGVAFPTEFTGKQGSGSTLLVFQRERPSPATDKWAPLFNGKDTKGWKTQGDQPGNWRVENDILVGSGKRSHLFSERGDFENFHLRVEAKINAGGNSGVLFRTEYGLSFDQKLLGGAGMLPSGYEADIHTTEQPDPTGSVWRLGMRDGKPAAWNWKANTPNIRPDTWFTMEVIAQGNRIKTLLDGKLVLETTDDIDLFRRGHVTLQVDKEGTVVQFRKIEIKELPPTPK